MLLDWPLAQQHRDCGLHQFTDGIVDCGYADDSFGNLKFVQSDEAFTCALWFISDEEH